MANRRDPETVQVWLIGSGIASLAAAVYFIKEAKVPATHIHILESHSGPGGGITSGGDALTGYVLHQGPLSLNPFHDPCTEDFLSLVPSLTNPEGKSLLQEIKDFNSQEQKGQTAQEKEKEQRADYSHHYQQYHHERPASPTRVLVEGTDGPQKLDIRKMGLGLRDRFELFQVMIESEQALQNKMISDIFSPSFFASNFWIIWSTTFAFQPWHSAIEFRRYLRKYLHEVHHLGSLSPNTPDRTRYSQYESIILPVTSFLKREGVDFRFGDKVVNILTYPDSDPTTVSEIKMLSPDGQDELLVTVDPVDLVIVTLGSVGSGSVLGANTRAPEMLLEEVEDGDWSLWQKFADKSTKFGNPSNFSTRGSASTLETFTITLHDDAEFMTRLVELTHDKAGTQPFITLNESNWILTLSVPHQPVFPGQPENVQVIWGYALRPERQGNFVRKPMVSCTGEEIMTELLNHLKFPVQSILSKSITIPCVMPRATAPFLTRERRDRPEVTPRDTTNLGLVGQFVEIPDETTGGMEYSIRGAQIAVFRLMGLEREPTRARRSHMVEFLDLLT